MKEIVDSYGILYGKFSQSQFVLSQYFENVYRLTNSWTPSSKALAYVSDRENFADNVITTTRLVNKMTFADGKGLQNNVTISGQPKGITKRRYQYQTLEQISKNTTRAVIANVERLLFLRA